MKLDVLSLLDSLLVKAVDRFFVAYVCSIAVRLTKM